MAKLRAGIEMDDVEMDNGKAHYIDVKRKVATGRHNYKSDDQLSSHRNNHNSNKHSNNNVRTCWHEADGVATGGRNNDGDDEWEWRG
jgi:hypothetical protein